ncbi:copper amine oxidase N-terminal domain-containing protein [Paenibacillus sp. R14(2021)]|nr:copper amine oxidase N-terminal domain-containing protein [Paenibacillus sp. R14(2021)]
MKQDAIGKSYIEFDGKRMGIGTPVVLKDGRTQLPLRFILK